MNYKRCLQGQRPNRWSAHMALQSDSNEMQYLTLPYLRLHTLKYLPITTFTDSNFKYIYIQPHQIT